MLEDFGFEEVGLLHPDGAPHGLAVFEEDECRHRLHAVAGGQFGILVDVDFDDCGRVADLLLHLLKDGALHLAGATPGGEEVDKCGF